MRVALQYDISLSTDQLNAIGPDGEVWFASTHIGEQLFGYLFVADLSEDWKVYPSDLGLDNSKTYIVREANWTTQTQVFNGHSPLTLTVR